MSGCRERSAVVHGRTDGHARGHLVVQQPADALPQVRNDPIVGGIVRTGRVSVHAAGQVAFQTIENLHAAVPHHRGDWYFTGKYPTPGGYRVVNQAYVNFYEKNDKRAY